MPLLGRATRQARGDHDDGQKSGGEGERGHVAYFEDEHGTKYRTGEHRGDGEQATHDGETLFEAAKRKAVEAVRAANAGDGFSLIVLEGVANVRVPGPSNHFDAVQDESCRLTRQIPITEVSHETVP